MKDYLSLAEAAEIIGKSKETLRRWDKEGILNAVREPVSNYRMYHKNDVAQLLGSLFAEDVSHEVSNYVTPDHRYGVL
jgi:DNA (cytosine-5)-methyltransferase 1